MVETWDQFRQESELGGLHFWSGKVEGAKVSRADDRFDLQARNTQVALQREVQFNPIIGGELAHAKGSKFITT